MGRKFCGGDVVGMAGLDYSVLGYAKIEGEGEMV